MKLDVYKTRDLQHVLQILTQAEELGVTDIRFVRERLHKHMYRIKTSRRKNKNTQYENCPYCVSIPMRRVDSGDEEVGVVGCSKCKFSRILI